MAVERNRKIIVSAVGIAVAIALLVVLYHKFGKTYVTQWREGRREIQQRETRLEELRKKFSNQADPSVELTTLHQEIDELSSAVQRLEKVKVAGLETRDLPQDLEDEDVEIRKELYRDYIRDAMELTEENIKTKMKAANITLPPLELYTELENADEAAYYMNRASGLGGLFDAAASAREGGGTVAFNELTLEDYMEGKARRKGAINVLSYDVKMTLDNGTFVSFLYNLREQDNFYFFESLTIEPKGTAQPGPHGQRLDIEARINTTMVFMSQVEKQVQAAALSTGTGRGKAGGWMDGMMAAMEKKREEAIAAQNKEKKWYEFWK